MRSVGLEIPAPHRRSGSLASSGLTSPLGVDGSSFGGNSGQSTGAQALVSEAQV